MFRINVSIFLLTLYIDGRPLAFVTKNNSSGNKTTLRLDEISTILLDVTMVELLVVCQNTSNTQDRSQSVNLGSNTNELDYAILQHKNVTRILQNPSAGYENLVLFEESGRKFIVADEGG